MVETFVLTLPQKTCRCPHGVTCNCEALTKLALQPKPRVTSAPIPPHLLRLPKR